MQKIVSETQIENMPNGGALVGKREGQTIIHEDGSMGGYLVGKLHKEGGIKAVNKATGKPLEMQGAEVVITAPAVADQTKRMFEGKLMTNREILSKINSDAGGVSFENGGEIPGTLYYSGKQYEYGGKMMYDHDIINACGCTHEEYENGGQILGVNTFNKMIEKEWLKGWRLDYENDTAKINEMVARHYLYGIAEKLFGSVNEIDFVNESKKPINHFQMRMYLGDKILMTSPFIYVDNNHKLILKKTKVELLDDNYNIINSNIKYESGGSLPNEEKNEIYQKWQSLVNMSKSELKAFYDSEEGKQAGLSEAEANELGIGSGRESAKWIMRMKETNKEHWTPKMWDWAKRQISFISRMQGNKGSLYNEDGSKTRKHTSLLIWGHNPENFQSGGFTESDNNGKTWVAYILTNNGLLLSEKFQKPITHKELYNKYQKQGYVIKDAQIKRVDNIDIIDSYKNEVSKYIKERYNQMVDWQLTFIPYEIVDNKIIVSTNTITTTKGNQYQISPADLFNAFESGGSISSNLDYDILSPQAKKYYNVYTPETTFEKGIEAEKSEHSQTLDKLQKGEISKEEAIKEIVKAHIAEKPNYYENYQNGGGVSNLVPVEVIFEDSQYNYKTTVNGNQTDSEIRKYFVDKSFDVGTYPKELFKKVVDVKILRNNKENTTGSTEDSFKDIRQSLDEFFTPKFLATIMVQLAEKYGFKGGKILEPSFGKGVFFDALKEKGYNESDFFGFEIYDRNYDYVKTKYPKATLIKHNFEYEFAKNNKALIRDGIFSNEQFQATEFDLTIGNPPYGKHKSPYAYLFKPELQVRYEGFFIYLALLKMKKGALLVFVINSLWLRNDNTYNKQKEEIFKLGELIDAYRLPNNIFVGENRDTSIATDIVIFRKK